LFLPAGVHAADLVKVMPQVSLSDIARHLRINPDPASFVRGCFLSLESVTKLDYIDKDGKDRTWVCKNADGKATGS
jgi:hypothetical protein